MSAKPKKTSVEGAPQHSWPVVSPGERQAGPKSGLWQRIRDLFRRWPAVGGRTPLVTPENSMPSLEPVDQTFASDDDDFLFFPEENNEDLAKLAVNNLGTVILFSCVDVIFDKRPFDVPFYTARKSRACIALIFSEKIMPHAVTLERVASGDHPMALNLTAIPDDESLLLRADLMFPDNLRTPLVLETLLDLCDEDVQEFLQAAADTEELDLLLRHESSPETTIDLSVSAHRLGWLVQNQVTALGRDRSPESLPTAPASDSQERVRVHRSSQEDIARDGGIKLRRIGRAKCLLR